MNAKWSLILLLSILFGGCKQQKKHTGKKSVNEEVVFETLTLIDTNFTVTAQYFFNGKNKNFLCLKCNDKMLKQLKYMNPEKEFLKEDRILYINKSVASKADLIIMDSILIVPIVDVNYRTTFYGMNVFTGVETSVVTNGENTSFSSCSSSLLIDLEKQIIYALGESDHEEHTIPVLVYKLHNNILRYSETHTYPSKIENDPEKFFNEILTKPHTKF